jgi:hypothetical protein
MSDDVLIELPTGHWWTVVSELEKIIDFLNKEIEIDPSEKRINYLENLWDIRNHIEQSIFKADRAAAYEKAYERLYNEIK